MLYTPFLDTPISIIIATASSFAALYNDDACLMYPMKNVGAKPHVRPHPNNTIYLSLEDEWKHWLYAASLTLGFQDLGSNLGFWFLGF